MRVHFASIRQNQVDAEQPLPQSSRCLCRHEGCAQPGSHVQARGAGDGDLYPTVLDRFRLDRRVAAAAR
ncbi:MAG: hypothetical protein HY359_06290 [Candidatus Rokubacteria bacterium]|nr:hypothetical protein [Candidatus Rokubacteria bacterium]